MTTSGSTIVVHRWLLATVCLVLVHSTTWADVITSEVADAPHPGSRVDVSSDPDRSKVDESTIGLDHVDFEYTVEFDAVNDYTNLAEEFASQSRAFEDYDVVPFVKTELEDSTWLNVVPASDNRPVPLPAAVWGGAALMTMMGLGRLKGRAGSEV